MVSMVTWAERNHSMQNAQVNVPPNPAGQPPMKGTDRHPTIAQSPSGAMLVDPVNKPLNLHSFVTSGEHSFLAFDRRHIKLR